MLGRAAGKGQIGGRNRPSRTPAGPKWAFHGQDLAPKIAFHCPCRGTCKRTSHDGTRGYGGSPADALAAHSCPFRGFGCRFRGISEEGHAVFGPCPRRAMPRNRHVRGRACRFLAPWPDPDAPVSEMARRPPQGAPRALTQAPDGEARSVEAGSTSAGSMGSNWGRVTLRP